MNKHKMKGLRKALHELVGTRGRVSFSLLASGHVFVTINGDKYNVCQRGKHRSAPRGLQAQRLVYDDAEFTRLSVPQTVLSYGSKPFTKDLLETLSEARPKLGQVYKEKIIDGAATLPKDFFKIDPPIHELGLGCMEVAGMLPKGGIRATEKDIEEFFAAKESAVDGSEHGAYLEP